MAKGARLMILQGGTTFVTELDLEEAFDYTEHRRLGVFARKGTTCFCCGEEGTRFIVSVDNAGGVHYDVFSEQYSLMTADHVIPLAAGGADTFENKVPMCSDCNYSKASRNITVEELREFLFNKYSKIDLTPQE